MTRTDSNYESTSKTKKSTWKERLAYELSLIRYALGFSTPKEGNGANVASSDTPSFFPERLPFTYYWLLPFAAIAASLGPKPLSSTHSANTSHRPVGTSAWVAYVHAKTPTFTVNHASDGNDQKLKAYYETSLGVPGETKQISEPPRMQPSLYWYCYAFHPYASDPSLLNSTATDSHNVRDSYLNETVFPQKLLPTWIERISQPESQLGQEISNETPDSRSFLPSTQSSRGGLQLKQDNSTSFRGLGGTRSKIIQRTNGNTIAVEVLKSADPSTGLLWGVSSVSSSIDPDQLSGNDRLSLLSSADATNLTDMDSSLSTNTLNMGVYDRTQLSSHPLSSYRHSSLLLDRWHKKNALEDPANFIQPSVTSQKQILQMAQVETEYSATNEMEEELVTRLEDHDLLSMIVIDRRTAPKSKTPVQLSHPILMSYAAVSQPSTTRLTPEAVDATLDAIVPQQATFTYKQSPPTFQYGATANLATVTVPNPWPVVSKASERLVQPWSSKFSRLRDTGIGTNSHEGSAMSGWQGLESPRRFEKLFRATLAVENTGETGKRGGIETPAALVERLRARLSDIRVGLAHSIISTGSDDHDVTHTGRQGYEIVSPSKWLNHHHLVMLRRPGLKVWERSLRARSNNTDAVGSIKTVNRAINRMSDKVHRRRRKQKGETLDQRKRKRYNPRRPWLLNNHLDRFFVRRMRAHTKDGRIVPHLNHQRLYRTHTIWSKMPATVSDPHVFDISGEVLNVLRKNQRTSAWMRRHLTTYLTRVRRALDQAHAFSLSTVDNGFRLASDPLPIRGWKPNPNWLMQRPLRKRPSFPSVWDTRNTSKASDGNDVVRSTFLPSEVQLNGMTEAFWWKAIRDAEYNRAMYARMQYIIRQIHDNAGFYVSKAGRKRIAGHHSLLSSVPRDIRRPTNWLITQGRRMDERLQRAWSVRRAQDRAAHAFFLRDNPNQQISLEEEKQLKKRLKSRVNPTTEIWLHNKYRFRRSRSENKMIVYRWRKPWERQQPMRAKLQRVHRKAYRVSGVNSPGGNTPVLRRHLGPSSKFWWQFNGLGVQQPMITFRWNMHSSPTTQLALVLVHVCAISFLVSLPSVRDLIKFNLVVLYKVANVLTHVFDASQTVLKQASVPLIRSIGLFRPDVLWRAFWYGGKKKSMVWPSTSWSIWTQSNYTSRMLRLIPLVTVRSAARVVLYTWVSLELAGLRGIRAMVDATNYVLGELGRFFDNPVELSLDFVVYLFFIQWSADLTTVVPDTVDTQLARTGRKQLRGIVPLSAVLASVTPPWTLLLAPLLQRRLWFFAETFWDQTSQLDSDLWLRQERSHLMNAVWTEVIYEAAETYGIDVSTLESDVDQQRRLLNAIRTSPDGFALAKKYETDAFVRRIPFPNVHGPSNHANHGILGTDVFMESHPSASLRSVGSRPSGMHGLSAEGQLICQIYAGIFQQQISRNILLVGPANRVKTLWVQAIAGETELNLIRDNAHRYALVQNGVAVGIRLLRDVFDALAMYTPCLFLLEDIHVIGQRRSEALSDDFASSGMDGASTMAISEAFDPEPEWVQNQIVYQSTRHAIMHYGKPFRGDFSTGIPTHQFCFDLFFQEPVAMRRRQGLTISSPMPLDRIGAYLQQEREDMEALSTGDTGDSSSVHADAARILSSRLQYNEKEGLSIPPLSPLNLLSLKEALELNPQGVVDSLPFKGVPKELLALRSPATYAIRGKVTALAEKAFQSQYMDVNMLTDLLMLLDTVRSQRGFVLFATTHLPHVLDPALRRPGRLDETISLQPADGLSASIPQMVVSQGDRPLHSTTSVPYVSRLHALVSETRVTRVTCKASVASDTRTETCQILTTPRYLDRVRALAYSTVVGQWFGEFALTSGGISVRGMNQNYANLYVSRNNVKQLLDTQMAHKVGEAFATGLAGIRVNDVTSHNTSGHEALYALWDKRGWFGTHDFVSNLLQLQSLGSLGDPASPPMWSLTVPAKRYEHYRRVERDFQRQARFNVAQKLQLAEDSRLERQLHSLPTKESFRSETIRQKLASLESASREMLSPNVRSATHTLTGVQRYYRSRLIDRHCIYLMEQWWNGHLSEMNPEEAFLSEVDYRIQFRADMEKDVFIDFPEPEQYYNARERRWMSSAGSNGHTLFDARVELRDHITQHATLEAFNRVYAWCDERREALDHVCWISVNRGFVSEIHHLHTLKRFRVE